MANCRIKSVVLLGFAKKRLYANLHRIQMLGATVETPNLGVSQIEPKLQHKRNHKNRWVEERNPIIPPKIAH